MGGRGPHLPPRGGSNLPAGAGLGPRASTARRTQAPVPAWADGSSADDEWEDEEEDESDEWETTDGEEEGEQAQPGPPAQQAGGAAFGYARRNAMATPGGAVLDTSHSSSPRRRATRAGVRQLLRDPQYVEQLLAQLPHVQPQAACIQGALAQLAA